jgi:hypothetical protein
MWNVLAGWWHGMPGGSISLVWRDDNAAGRLSVKVSDYRSGTWPIWKAFCWSTAFSFGPFFDI